jgi:hypothetical protein
LFFDADPLLEAPLARDGRHLLRHCLQRLARTPFLNV